MVVAVLRDHTPGPRGHPGRVFAAVWQQASRFNPALSSTATWIRRLARSRAIDRVRVCESDSARDTRYTAANSTVDSDVVIEQVLHREEHACLREAVQQLRPLQRESIVLAYDGLGTEFRHKFSIGEQELHPGKTAALQMMTAPAELTARAARTPDRRHHLYHHRK